MKWFILICSFLSFVSYGIPRGEVQKYSSLSKKSQEEGGVSYAVLFSDDLPLCVTSLDNKPQLLPHFIQIPSTKKIFSSERNLSASLSLPLCNKDQETFISHRAQEMIQAPAPEQVAGFWFALPIWAFWGSIATNGVACVSSYYTAKHILTSDSKVIISGATTLLTLLLPGVVKAPIICGGIGAIKHSQVTYHNVEEKLLENQSSVEKMGEFENIGITQHPFLDSIVKIITSERLISNDEDTNSIDNKEDLEVTKKEEDKGLGAILKDLLNNPTNQKLGSGFFIDKDKILTNYHVVKAKEKELKDDEYDIIYEAILFDGQRIKVKEILAKDEKMDLAVLQLDQPIGKPVKLGNADNLNLLDEVVVSGSPLGLTGTLTKGYISQFRRDQGGINYIQYTSPTSAGNSGGALFLESSRELIGVPTFIVVGFVSQNLNFAISVKDVKKFLKNNGIKISSE